LEEWRLLPDDGERDPYVNLAVEEAVARGVGRGLAPPTIRLWCNRPAVVVGLSERVEAEVDLAFCDRRGIFVARRFTGGGTVFQDEGNLNFALSVGTGHPIFSADILATYALMAEGVIAGLALLGLDAVYSHDEIQLGGRKVSGFAGANDFGSVFRHGTLLVSTDEEMVYGSLRRIKREVTNLSKCAGRVLPNQEVGRALAAGFERRFGIVAVPGSLTGEERAIAAGLWRSKYSSRPWNLRDEWSLPGTAPPPTRTAAFTLPGGGGPAARPDSPAPASGP
jgi:lipoate-protein ligase A